MTKVAPLHTIGYEQTPAAAVLDELVSLARTGQRLCLLCYERDPAHCHRQWIAERVHKRTGARVEHLIVAPA